MTDWTSIKIYGLLIPPSDSSRAAASNNAYSSNPEQIERTRDHSIVELQAHGWRSLCQALNVLEQRHHGELFRTKISKMSRKLGKIYSKYPREEKIIIMIQKKDL